MPTIPTTVSDQKKFIYLASQSPRRSQLLDQLGVAHRLLLPDAHEDAESLELVLPNESPKTYVKRVTQLKLQAAVERLQRRGLPLAPILCADTTVALGASILGKPHDAADAKRILRELSGQTHRVITAIAMAWGTSMQLAVSESRVRFVCMTDEQIDCYVNSGEPTGKAGAYGVQGRAAAFIAHISGSYSGIMGLPLCETAQVLQTLGYVPCNKTY
jgi:septum formation protein